MKKILILTIAAIILLMTVLTGCVRVNLAEQNGPITTKYYSFSDFTGIDIGDAFELSITPSENYSVSITTGENLLQHINVHKDGTTLVFEVDGWTHFWFSSWYSSPKVNITMPLLDKLELSGAAKANVSGFKSQHNFDLRLSGASEINMDMETTNFFTELSGASKADGSLIASSSDIGLSGASHIRLIGHGGDIKLRGSGASDADLIGYAVNDADIDFSGASHVSLSVNGRMNISLSGASSLEYSGYPTIGKTDITGASSMKQVSAPSSDIH